MKMNLLKSLLISAVVFAIPIVTFAQETNSVSNVANKYVISAEAGGVNLVQGKVSIVRKFGRSGLLLKGDTVKIGDRVSTEADSKAEILLNPGSYIRIGGNASFEFIDTSLENLQIKLVRGAAIFEVITSDDFTFAVNTPTATFNVIRSGVYRIDVLENGEGKIEVWKGKAQIGDDDEATVKKGKTATVGGDEVAVAKFDRGDRDSLEEWSKQRAKELAKANDRLERNALRSTLLNGFNSSSWNLFDSFGLWVYDPFWGANCFLPFGYGWSSPYGFGFGRDIWYYRLPRYLYAQPAPRVIPNNGNANGNGNGNGNSNTTTREVRQSTVPPFQRVDQGRDGRQRVDQADFPSPFPGRNQTGFPSGSTKSNSSPANSDSVPIPSVKGKQDQ